MTATKHGVMHFNIECDMFVAPKKEYPSADSFLKDAIGEDAGYELRHKNGWNDKQVFDYLLPYVAADGYIVHRVGWCPSDTDIDDWWEFTKLSGRGHMKVWYLDMESVDV